ncbi:MAG TPA: hypothetical protein VIY72_05910 [Acidimicrobiales bacterium]
MGTPDTVVEAEAVLREDGYDIEFNLDDGHVRWEGGQASCSTADVVVERLYRFEGPSDPGDEMIVFGLRDPATGRLGYLSSGFGPAADPEVMDHLAGMASRFTRS